MAINMPRNRLLVSENCFASTSFTSCIWPLTIMSTVVGVTAIKQITASSPGNNEREPLIFRTAGGYLLYCRHANHRRHDGQWPDAGSERCTGEAILRYQKSVPRHVYCHSFG